MSATIARGKPASNGGSAQHYTSVMRAYNLLGGRRILKRAVTDALDAHDLIVRGIPSGALLHLVDRVAVPSTRDALAKAIGISLRTLQRRTSSSGETALSTEQGDRAWRFAQVITDAADALGSPEAAERWLLEPAMALGHRKPIDLLSTSLGTAAVRSYLAQLEYCVYI